MDNAQPLSAPSKNGRSKAKRIGVAEIAMSSGVSVAAVSSLLCSADGKGRVSAKTRATILKACRDLGYQPRGNAFSRIYPELGEHCFFLPSTAQCGFLNPFYAQLFKGLTEALPQPHNNIHFCQFQSECDYLASPEMLPSPIRDGIVTKAICAGKPNLSLLEALLDKNMAVICFGHAVPLKGLVSIFVDFHSGAKMAIEYLIKMGHRKIAIAGGPFADSSYNILQQRGGIQEALTAHGLSLAGEHIYYVPMDPEGGVAAVDLMLKNPNRPTALYCLNDAVALGVIQRAQMMGLRVPEDLSVVGFDDIPMAQTASLTTVRAPVAEMGRLAVEQVDVQFGSPERKNRPTNIMLPVELIQRGSVAAPAKASATAPASRFPSQAIADAPNGMPAPSSEILPGPMLAASSGR